MDQLHIRFAERNDIPLILTFIKELADYEKMLDQVQATEENLMETLFNQPKAEVIIGEINGEAAAFALFFTNYSTFLGQAGLYLEDLYLRPAFRGQGFGKQLLAYLAALAVKRNYGRFEWWCLDWNQSSIAFYQKMGAEAMEDWTVFRLTGDSLTALARQYKIS